jgi:hypothetical protein
MMKRLVIIIVISAVILLSCKKSGNPAAPVSGTVTIDNTTYQSSTYYVYGFSFSPAKKVSTIESPGPDIIIYDSPANVLSLQADNLNPSFYKVGDYPDSQAAADAFNNLKSVGTYQWTEMADPISDNQVWVYRSGTNCYAKLRIISTVNETRNNLPYGECTFEWVYQPDGSTTFPGK